MAIARAPKSLTFPRTASNVLIRSYGEFWDPELVRWGSPGAGQGGELVGRTRLPKRKGGRTVTVDVWNQRGIYVLYHEWRVVYVGRTTRNPLGPRLRAHHTGRLADRWDAFSWYGLVDFNKDGSLSRHAGTHKIERSVLNATLEALLIAIIDPPLNRRHERIGEAVVVKQDKSRQPLPIHTRLDFVDAAIDDLSADIAHLEERIEELPPDGRRRTSR